MGLGRWWSQHCKMSIVRGVNLKIEQDNGHCYGAFKHMCCPTKTWFVVVVVVVVVVSQELGKGTGILFYFESTISDELI